MHGHAFLDSLCTGGVSCHEWTSSHVNFRLMLVQFWFSHESIFRAIAPFRCQRPIAQTMACVTFTVLDLHVNSWKSRSDAAASLIL